MQKLTQSIKALALATAVVLVPTMASAADYNLVEGGFIQRDNYGRSDAGVRIAGMGDVVDALAVYGEFSSNDELNQFSTGLLFHAAINGEVDLFGGGGLEYVDVGPNEEVGFGLRGGARWSPSNTIEFTPELRYYNAFDRGEVSLRLGGAYHINPRFALVAALQGGDDDRAEAGIRYYFRR